MWKERELKELNPSFGGTETEKSAYMGSNGATFRLGRGMRGRVLPAQVYKRLPPDQRGPYLPVIIEACQEQFLSYEYRDGATSYGAFTYSLAKNLRARPRSTFNEVVTRTADTLKNLGYRQIPQIIGPASVVNKPIPGIKTKAGKSRE